MADKLPLYEATQQSAGGFSLEHDGSSASVPDALHDLLIQLGTRQVPHSRRTLYEHLCGVESILRAWQQPQEMCKAGMFHSIYSTDRFIHAVLPVTDRPRLQLLIGEDAERLVYLFATLRREFVFRFADSCSSFSSEVHVELPCRWNDKALVQVSGKEIMRLVFLLLANRLEQATKPATGIGFWLSFMSDRTKSLRASGETLPKALAGLGPVTFDDERRLHSLYMQGIRFLLNDEPQSALIYLDRACRDCGYVGEPYLMCAFARRLIGDLDSAQRTASKGLEILKNWGAPWHKRLSMERWCKLSDLIMEEAPIDDIRNVVRGMLAANDQARVFDSESVATESETGSSLTKSPQKDVSRFFSYLRTVQVQRSQRAIKWYPGLARIPWYDPAQFPVARELESRYAEIKAEAMKVQSAYYHEEAEEIGRTGNWQVCMFYEQGRRNDYVCDQCPTITAILESHPSVRRSAGLIYLSKMAPHTHVAPHQGSSNLRLRCHLAISIPHGDCAIRVGDCARRWEDGKCMVFDDTFEHEVWNRTDEDRLVLLIDLWHPDLTSLERDALDALNWLSVSQAAGIVGAWRRNDSQRRREGKLEATGSVPNSVET